VDVAKGLYEISVAKESRILAVWLQAMESVKFSVSKSYGASSLALVSSLVHATTLAFFSKK